MGKSGLIKGDKKCNCILLKKVSLNRSYFNFLCFNLLSILLSVLNRFFKINLVLNTLLLTVKITLLLIQLRDVMLLYREHYRNRYSWVWILFWPFMNVQERTDNQKSKGHGLGNGQGKLVTSRLCHVSTTDTLFSL